MKEFINSSSKIYCDYTVFLNDSFELFCESNEQDIRDSCVKLIIPQAVVDEMKAVPISRTDDYILCCQGLERVNQAVKSGIAEFAENPDGIEFSEDFFYRLCETSGSDIIVLSGDIRLVMELDRICAETGKHSGFLTVLEIEENGMIHRLR